MSKVPITLTALTLGVASLGFYTVTNTLPTTVKHKTETFFNTLGFEGMTFETSDIRFTAARFEKITLDEDHLNTIKTLELEYSPLTILFGGPLTAVKIYDLNITGALNADYSIDVDGWTPRALNIAAAKTKTILLQKAKIALLTPNYGGINFDFDLQTRTQGSQITLDGRLKSQQHNMSLITGITGFINQDGSWQSELDIERGKIALSTIKATRMSGKASLSQTPGAPLTIKSEFQAGGLNLDGLPWQNASGSLEGTFNNLSAFLDMKSLGGPQGVEPIELGLHIVRKDGGLNISGLLHTASVADVNAYLKPHEDTFLHTIDLTPYENEDNSSIEFTLEPKVIFGDQ